jgi:hypothetical protein
MPLEMKSLACLSTGHVTADVAAELDALIAIPPPLAARLNPEIWQAQIVAERWQDYGWFIWVPSLGRAVMPSSLRACLDYAEAAGAEWLQFDRDCAPIADLPQFDW